MKKLIMSAALIWVLFSCDRFEAQFLSGHSRGGSVENKAEVTASDLLVSAVSFPEDYNWRRDTAYGSVKGASILLFKGRDTLVEIACGEETFVRTDFDMHHILDGHLITEYPTKTITVISSDGEELFRYPGRERLKGLAHKDGALYTLGENRSGEGFSLRKNGVEIFSREEGKILGDMDDMGYSPSGAIYWDGDDGPYFSYWKNSSGMREWYQYEDGRTDRIELPEGVDSVYDLRVIEGCRWCIAKKGGLPVLYKDLSFERALFVEDEAADDYRIAQLRGEICVYGTYLRKMGGHRRDSQRVRENTAIWYPGGRVRIFDGLGYIYPSSDSLSFVRISTLPNGYNLLGYSCGYFSGEDTFLGLSPYKDSINPCLFYGGKGLEYRINGFLSGLSLP